MIANAEKFKTIIFEKGNVDTNSIPLKIDNSTIKCSKDVTLLGLTIDCKLSFSKHISDICKKAANQLNAIKRFQKHLTNDMKRQVAKAFVMSNFNYCPILWHNCGIKAIHMIEKIQERVSRFIYNDYNTDYVVLVETKGESTIYTKRIRLIAQMISKKHSIQ